MSSADDEPTTGELRMTDLEVRLAAEERDRLAAQVAEQVRLDRLEDEAREAEARTARVRYDRLADADEERHLTTDTIRDERRLDEKPREKLEEVRADRLERSIDLTESVRKLCYAVLAAMLVLGIVAILTMRQNASLQEQQKVIACDLYGDDPPIDLECP